MSIFTKDCPRCAEANPADAIHCVCGFCFHPEKVEGVDANLEISAQDEELYEAYLAARHEQAEKNKEVALSALATDAGNAFKENQAKLAVKEAEQAKADYEAQRERTANAINAAKKARTIPMIHHSLPLEESTTSKTRLPALPAPKVTEKVIIDDGFAPPVRDIPRNVVVDIQSKRKPGQSIKPDKTFRKTLAGRADRALNAARKARAKSSIKNADTIKAELEAQFAKTAAALKAAKAARRYATNNNTGVRTLNDAQKSRPATYTALPPPAILPQPDSGGKGIYTAPALTPANDPQEKHVAPATANGPHEKRASEVFTYEQGMKAASLIHEIEKKICPNCTSKQPADAVRCLCGFLFSEGAANLPSLSLSSKDHEALGEGIRLSKVPR